MNLAEHLRPCRNRPADLGPLVNDRYQLIDGEPTLSCMDHAVTVGACGFDFREHDMATAVRVLLSV